MHTIQCDRATLRSAVVLLLDPRFGESRTEVLGKIIRDGSAKRFQRAGAPINELIRIAKQDGGATFVMNLIQLVNRKRDSLASGEEEAFPNVAKRKATCRENMARYRHRVNLVVKTEELHIGRRLKADEREALIDKAKKDWQEKRVNARAKCSSGSDGYRDAMKKYADDLDKELEEAYEAARANPGTRSVAAKRLKQLEERYNARRNW